MEDIEERKRREPEEVAGRLGKVRKIGEDKEDKGKDVGRQEK
jgi:hypothetical protein